MKRGNLLIIAILFLMSIFIITSANALDIPKYSGYVNDYADIIDASYESQLTNLITFLEENTSAEIAVVTIPSLEDESLEGYSVRLAEEWGIGKADVDNGVLLLVALKERQYRIEIGYGIEPIIPDAVAGRIGRDVIKPNFINGDYGKGIFEAVGVIGSYLMDNREEIASFESGDGKDEKAFWVYLITFGIVLIYVIIALSVKKKTSIAAKVFTGILFTIFLTVVLGQAIAAIIVFGAIVKGLGYLVLSFMLGVAVLAPVKASTGAGTGVWMSGGKGGFGGGGGFGGFGGGSFGGGGFSGGW